MKDLKFSIYCVCLLLAFFVFTACKKDKEPSTENHLSFKIDGVYWESDKEEVFGSYHLSEAIGPKLINIAGARGSGDRKSTRLNSSH